MLFKRSYWKGEWHQSPNICVMKNTVITIYVNCPIWLGSKGNPFFYKRVIMLKLLWSKILWVIYTWYKQRQVSCTNTIRLRATVSINYVLNPQGLLTTWRPLSRYKELFLSFCLIIFYTKRLYPRYTRVVCIDILWLVVPLKTFPFCV